MSRYDFQIPVTFKHRIVFTRDAFAPENSALAEVLAEGNGRRAIVFLEKSVEIAWPALAAQILAYFEELDVEFLGTQSFDGGETAKPGALYRRRTTRRSSVMRERARGWIVWRDQDRFRSGVPHAVPADDRAA